MHTGELSEPKFRTKSNDKRLEHLLMVLSALGFLSMASIYLLFI